MLSAVLASTEAAAAGTTMFGLATNSVPFTVLILSVAAALGLAIGSLKIRGIGLGIAGVLFAGILVGDVLSRYGVHLTPEVMDFIREFGLILFVYTIGVQIGPGFFASFRRQGIKLNALAGANVLLGAALTVILYFALFAPPKFPAAVGIFSGATTNTPSLAASQEALKPYVARVAETDADAAERVRALPGIGYAVAYPFGIVGIILCMVLVRAIFRVDVAKESDEADRAGNENPAIRTMNLEVTNANLDHRHIREIPLPKDSGVVISRVLHEQRTAVARPETELRVGDTLLAVGPMDELEQLKLIVGSETTVDLKAVPSDITTQRVIVTQTGVLNRTIGELDVPGRHGVQMTRVSRGDIELPANPTLHLQFGDRVTIVGPPDALKVVAAELGNSVKRLNHPEVIPIFVGIILGVILGSIPLKIGLPAPVKLGMAGGPLVVAILLSRLGKFGPVVWYMPDSANFIMRELGIVLFLAVVGIKAGGTFLSTLLGGDGLTFLAVGAAVTFVPLLVVALVGRIFMKTNYVSLCGVLAGSMTDPPALAFANAVTQGQGAATAYATVYPLTMLLRIFAAQAMALYLIPG